MSYFLASILSSTLIYLAFKLFPRFGVKRFQAIVVNYWVAFGLGCFLSERSAWEGLLDKDWIYLVPIEGLLFISIFNVMAMTVQHYGVSIGTIASRTAMIIPAVLLMILDPLETFALSKILAIGLACTAVILCTSKDKSSILEPRYLYLPMLLFIGSGLIDFVIGYVEHFLIQDPAEVYVFIPSIFFIAACTGSFIAIGRFLKNREESLGSKDLVAGVILGSINYASLYFIIQAMKTELIGPSLFFPVNNLGVVIAGVLMGALVFSEKLSTSNKYGIALGIVSIGIMIFVAE